MNNDIIHAKYTRIHVPGQYGLNYRIEPDANSQSLDDRRDLIAVVVRQLGRAEGELRALGAGLPSPGQ